MTDQDNTPRQPDQPEPERPASPPRVADDSAPFASLFTPVVAPTPVADESPADSSAESSAGASGADAVEETAYSGFSDLFTPRVPPSSVPATANPYERFGQPAAAPASLFEPVVPPAPVADVEPAVEPASSGASVPVDRPVDALADQRPVDQTPADEMSADQTPADRAPVDEAQLNGEASAAEAADDVADAPVEHDEAESPAAAVAVPTESDDQRVDGEYVDGEQADGQQADGEQADGEYLDDAAARAASGDPVPAPGALADDAALHGFPPSDGVPSSPAAEPQPDPLADLGFSWEELLRGASERIQQHSPAEPPAAVQTSPEAVPTLPAPEPSAPEAVPSWALAAGAPADDPASESGADDRGTDLRADVELAPDVAEFGASGAPEAAAAGEDSPDPDPVVPQPAPWLLDDDYDDVLTPRQEAPGAPSWHDLLRGADEQPAPAAPAPAAPVAAERWPWAETGAVPLPAPASEPATEDAVPAAVSEPDNEAQTGEQRPADTGDASLFLPPAPGAPSEPASASPEPEPRDVASPALDAAVEAPERDSTTEEGPSPDETDDETDAPVIADPERDPDEAEAGVAAPEPSLSFDDLLSGGGLASAAEAQIPTTSVTDGPGSPYLPPPAVAQQPPVQSEDDAPADNAFSAWLAGGRPAVDPVLGRAVASAPLVTPDPEPAPAPEPEPADEPESQPEPRWEAETPAEPVTEPEAPENETSDAGTSDVETSDADTTEAEAPDAESAAAPAVGEVDGHEAGEVSVDPESAPDTAEAPLPPIVPPLPQPPLPVPPIVVPPVPVPPVGLPSRSSAFSPFGVPSAEPESEDDQIVVPPVAAEEPQAAMDTTVEDRPEPDATELAVDPTPAAADADDVEAHSDEADGGDEADGDDEAAPVAATVDERERTPQQPEEVTPALRELAGEYGVATEFWDWHGEHRAVPRRTLVAVLAAMEVDASSDEAVDASLAAARERSWRRVLPPVVVLRQGKKAEVAVHLPHGSSVDAWVVLEDGSRVRPEQLDRWVEPRLVEGTLTGQATFGLPADLPLGWHELQARIGDETSTAPLVVAPDKLALPAALREGRAWGYMTQLYSVRSRSSWGLGDLADLSELATWSAREQGAGFILVNPLHAAEPIAPMTPSPYLPTTRRFVNPVYLRVEDIREVGYLPATDRAILEWHAEAMRAMNTLDAELDRDSVWAAKRSALETVFAYPRSPAREVAFRAFIEREGQGLVDFATWCALAERYGLPAHTWPEHARDPRSEAVAQLREELADRVEFHMWLQWCLDDQLATVQRQAREAGMPIGVVHDLAVGVHPDGAEPWALQGTLAGFVSVGAPPDAFNQQGQDWSQPPWRPDRLAEAGYAPYRDMLRTILRHAGGVRVDHILGLFRLWWIPNGQGPAEGTYVRYDHEAMVGILALEAHRAGAFVVGEDLGTVEPWVRDYLRDRGVLGTSVAWWERGDGGRPLGPQQWRELCLATVTTHDLPPTAGYLAGEHIEVRQRLGLLTRSVEEETRIDEADREQILAQLRDLGLLGAESSEREKVEALHRFLTRTPAKLLGVALPDAVGDRRAMNQPGTNDEYPNWRLPLADGVARPVLLEDLMSSPRAASLGAVMNS